MTSDYDPHPKSVSMSGAHGLRIPSWVLRPYRISLHAWSWAPAENQIWLEQDGRTLRIYHDDGLIRTEKFREDDDAHIAKMIVETYLARWRQRGRPRLDPSSPRFAATFRLPCHDVLMALSA